MTPFTALFLALVPPGAAEPAFGNDLSVGLGAASLLGRWPEPGVSPMVRGRLDAFVQDASVTGPRLGLSIHASAPVLATQVALEVEEEQTWEVDATWNAWGVMGILRFDPALPWTGLFGVGMGRLDLDAYWGGPYGVPMAEMEAGVRRGVRGPWFGDLLARAAWGSVRNTAFEVEDLWLLSLDLSLGLHAR